MAFWQNLLNYPLLSITTLELWHWLKSIAPREKISMILSLLNMVPVLERRLSSTKNSFMVLKIKPEKLGTSLLILMVLNAVADKKDVWKRLSQPGEWKKRFKWRLTKRLRLFFIAYVMEKKQKSTPLWFFQLMKMVTLISKRLLIIISNIWQPVSLISWKLWIPKELSFLVSCLSMNLLWRN